MNYNIFKHVKFIIPMSLVVLASCSKIQLTGITGKKSLNIIENYNTIEVESAIEFDFSSEATTVEVESDANLLPYIEVYVSRNTLHIGYKRGTRIGSGYYKTEVTVPYKSGISTVELSGASEFESDLPLSANVFTLKASGASRFSADVTADNINAELSGASLLKGKLNASKDMNVILSGASSLIATGTVGQCIADISGASLLAGSRDESAPNAYGLYIDQFRANLSGASEAYLSSNGTIAADLSGGSVIYYKGTAAIKEHVVSGGSSINKMD